MRIFQTMSLCASILVLSSCTQTSLDFGDAHLTYQRFATDAAVKVAISPDGTINLDYSSSPSAIAQQSALELATKAVGLVALVDNRRPL